MNDSILFEDGFVDKKRECYRNVTAEDILFCTIIVITSFRDVVPPVSDVINVISQVNF